MRRTRAVALLGIFLNLSSCSSASLSQHEHREIVPHNLRVRRPAGPGAHPDAGPGGIDYTSHPLPNERLDCETADRLISGVNFEALRACLIAQVGGGEVKYRLKRTAVPSLVLDEPKSAPPCLVQHLKEIPVPREILFQAVREERLECFSSRLDIEADEVLGEKMPFDTYELILRFPLPDLLNTDDEMKRVLTSWVLTPFWEIDGKPKLPSRYVPRSICKACFGEASMLKDDDVRETWPPR